MDVCIHITPDGKEVHLLDLKQGTPSAPIAAETLDQQLYSSALSADTIRATVLENNQMLAETGRQLFAALLKGDVLIKWKERLQQCKTLEGEWEQNDRKGDRPLLRTYLCVQNPAMAEIPWELLTDHLSLFADESTPWTRCLDLHLPARQDSNQYRVRVLVINGTDPADKGIKAEEEAAAVREMLAKCEDGFEFDIAPRFQTINDLEKYIKEYEPHVLHFIGHSEFDVAGQPLLLISDGATYLPWRGAYIRGFLQSIPTLRLSYLNACRTGTKGQSDQKAALSLSDVFLQRSLAVIGMHHDIRGSAAATCAREFYGALVERCPVDQSLARARHAMLTEFNNREPYLPALILRAESAQIVALRQRPNKLDPEDFDAEVKRRVTKHFVNHRLGRRQLHGLFGGPLADKRAILVTGNEGTGKTWLIQWVLHALALRGVRVHYLSKPTGDWLSILRQIRDEGQTPLQQGCCTEEQANRFNWALRNLSSGKDPQPWPGGTVQDSGDDATSIVDKKADLPKKLCIAMQASLEGSAGDGLVLALDQWDLGPLGLEHPDFKLLSQHLLNPLVRKKDSGVRVILALNSSPRINDLPGWYPLEVPLFPKREVADLAEELVRRIYPNEADAKLINLIRPLVTAEQTAGRLYENLIKLVNAIRAFNG